MRSILMNQRKASRLPDPRYPKRELLKVRANKIYFKIVKLIWRNAKTKNNKNLIYLILINHSKILRVKILSNQLEK